MSGDDHFVEAVRLLGFIIHKLGGSVEFQAGDIEQFKALDPRLTIDPPDDERRTYRVRVHGGLEKRMPV